MNSSFRIARLLGIPVEVNLTWIIFVVFITAVLALQYYPEFIGEASAYRNDKLVHWGLALASGLLFFLCILIHEFAHSVFALKYGIPVKSITLFVLGGVSQIGGEARRPRHEFIMAIVGPFSSLILGVLFFGLWYLVGLSNEGPGGVMLQWLFLVNVVIAVFNMAPGFPMDGGRVLRSLIWGVSGNIVRATFFATTVGRCFGYFLMILGVMAFLGLVGFLDNFSGAWLVILGLFIESSARQSWFQAKAMDVLNRYAAEEVMTSDLETAGEREMLRYLMNRGGERYIFFVEDPDEHVIGVLTEKEVEALAPENRDTAVAREAMVGTRDVPTAGPRETGAAMLQRMEADSVWHLPVVSEGRVVGVVSKESLLRLLARGLFPPAHDPAGQP